MITRLLAIVAALGMVFGAYVYRYGMPGGDGKGADVGPSGDRAGAIVCASELGEDVCDALGDEVTIEPAATTAARLLGARTRADGGVAVWLTPGPWADMVEEGRSGTSLFDDEAVLATTPLVAVVKKGRTPAVCAPSMTWKCLADAVQDPANSVGAEPATSPTGLFTRAGILVGVFGNTAFGSNDFPDAQPTLDAFRARADDAAARGAKDLTRFLTVAPGVPLYLTTRAGAIAGPSVDIVVPEPVISVHATVATAGDQQVDRKAVAKALVAAGWANGRDSASGLPSPGVLLALREAVQ